MLYLACPRSRVSPTFPRDQRAVSFPLMCLLALMAATTGCASLNAGSTASTTSKPAQQIAIAAQLPPATVGNAYTAAMSVSGGSAPYNFSIRGGSFPPGLYINASTGAIAGQPLRAGTYAFLVSVLDHAHTAEGVQKFALTVKPATKPAVQVAVSPQSLTIASGASHQFAAQVSNTTNHAVTWWASAGKITAAGLFTAPKVNAPANVEIIATSKADLSKNAFVSVSVNAGAVQSSSLTLASAALPNATEGVPYSAGLRATGGTSPYRWKIAAGSLPAGFAFDAAGGGVSGVATQNGPFPVTIQAMDAAGQSVSRQFMINVSPASTGNLDGPAELPRVYIKSSLADTPAPGAVHTVKTSAALQPALDAARCGDTILLQAGATFEGTMVLPAKNCDDNHWIVIRTSAPNSALPPEGTRISPCYAGVTSLPGRPAFKCSSTSNVLAKVVFTGAAGSGPIVMADGANHYRLLGLEVTRPASKATVYNLVINEHGGTTDRIVIDRSWLHGTAHDETARGITLTASTNFAVVDSFFSDFHCVAITGSCGDSQAIAGGMGNHAMGPFKIVNNYLEAAGENIIFGGGAATRTPEDIEIRRNYFFKPLIWMKGTAGFVGGRDGHPFIVKNHLEFKNAARVLVEGNVMENSWGGFSQFGFSILLTPKNQNGQCPLCVLHDVTIRYGTITNVGNGITIGNGKSDSGDLSLGAWNESIHDLVITHVDGKLYVGGGHIFQQGNSNPENPLHNVAISHVTAIGDDPTAGMLVLGNALNHPLAGFSWTNNILAAPNSGIITTGGGSANCAYPGFGGGPLGKLERCFKDYDFSGNVLIGATGAWPKDNQSAANQTSVMFASTIHQALSSFQLQAVSPFRGMGTDGKNPGADVSGVAAAIAGVAP